MSTTSQCISSAEAIQLMNDLFGLEVVESKQTPSDVYSIAEYVDGSGDIVGYVACDLGTGCRLGAALTQIPPGHVDQAIAIGKIPENIAENLSEVFNIAVSLFTTDGGRIVLQRSAHGDADEHFSDIQAEMEKRSASDVGFELARYGSCCLTVRT